MKRTTHKLDKLYLGFDNGITGTIGVCGNLYMCEQVKTPTFSEQNYTKAKGNVTRINTVELLIYLKQLQKKGNLFAILERPMVNPGRFKATITAMRALEATLGVLEQLSIPYQYIDSKEWQKEMLPKGTKGSAELKKAGIDIAKRLFPSVVCKPDADGILIAEWARRKQL